MALAGVPMININANELEIAHATPKNTGSIPLKWAVSKRTEPMVATQAPLLMIWEKADIITIPTAVTVSSPSKGTI